MSSNYNQNLWLSVLSEVKKTIQKEQYDLWFQKTQLILFSKDKMKLRVPNQLCRERLQKNYISVIQEAVYKCSGESPNLEITVIGEEDEEEERLPEQLGREIGYYWKEPSENPRISESVVETQSKILEQQKLELPKLNGHYTFENFVVGPTNQLAHAAAMAVADSPGKVYNPLFMHGPVGVGKTHLLQAICHALLNRQESRVIVYLSCEEFINQFISAVERGELDSFRYNYRHIEVLVIDDIHFLADKERTQEEFFHTFNTLYNEQKQIVLSCDSPPKEIPSLEERLVSRFKWGLETKIEYPGFETRVAIIKKKSKLRGEELPDDVCQYIARYITTNIRELEGALNKIIATKELLGGEVTITLDFAKKCLKEILEFQENKVSITDILSLVATHFNVKLSELQSKKRLKSIVFPRQVCMYLAKNLTSHSLQEIGGYCGGRDHTTVLHALEKINEMIDKEKNTENLIKQLSTTLLEKSSKEK